MPRILAMLILIAVPAIFASTGRTANGVVYCIGLGAEFVLIFTVWATVNALKGRRRRREIARQAAEAAALPLPGATMAESRGLTWGGGVGNPEKAGSS